MNIDELYAQAMKTMTEGARAQFALGKKESQDLIHEFQFEITKEKLMLDQVKKYLCVINHLRRPDQKLSDLLGELARRKDLDKDLMIFTIQGLLKHCLGMHLMQGQRFSKEWLILFESLLQYPDSEVQTWAIRLIDELGPQKIFFKQSILNLRPSAIKSWFHPKSLVLKQLIDQYLHALPKL
jgi:hypothetical protein